MNTVSDQNTQGGRPESPDALEALFRHVGARERPPRSDEEAIRAAVHEEWLRVTRLSRRRRIGAWALAASAVLALAVVLVLPGGPAPGQGGARVATVEKVVGTASQSMGGDQPAVIGTQAALSAAARITTSAGSGLALRWANGTAIRVDEQTELLLESASGMRLMRGAVYVDTGTAQPGSDALEIITPQGLVRHLGTRYMTRVTSTGTRISVRSGQIAFQSAGAFAGDSFQANAGERLAVPEAGSPRVEQTSTWGDDWAWTETLSPEFAADGRSVDELFRWVAAETGRELAYDSAEARQVAAQSRLRGTVALEPLSALSVASATTDLVAAVDGGEIRVELRAR